MWKDWSSLSPGLCVHNLNSAKPGVQLPGLKWDFFFSSAGCRGAVISALATDYSIGRGGDCISSGVLM